MPGTGDYLIIGAVAAVVTFAATPLVSLIARRFDWLDHPNELVKETAQLQQERSKRRIATSSSGPRAA